MSLSLHPSPSERPANQAAFTNSTPPALAERLLKQRETLTVLMRRKLGSSEILIPALREITEQATLSLNVATSSLWLFDDDQTTLRCIDRFDASSREHTSGGVLDASHYRPMLTAIEAERAVAVEDCANDPRSAALYQAHLLPREIVSRVDASVWVDGVLVGILCHEHRGLARTWELDEVLFAGSLADMCSLTFEVCELRHTEEILAQRVDFKELIARLSARFINVPEDSLDTSLRESLEVIGECCHVDASVFYRYDEAQKAFVLHSQWVRSGFHSCARNDASPPLSVVPSTLLPHLAECLMRGETITLGKKGDRGRKSTLDRRVLRAHGVASLLCVPMTDQGNTVGFLAFVIESRDWEWHPDTEALLHFVAEMFLSVLKRKQTEEILRAMRFAIDHAGDAVFWIAPDGTIRYVNESALQSLGYTREELLARRIWEISASLTADQWPEHWRRLQGGNPITFESTQRTKNGKVFPVEITINHLRVHGEEHHCAFVRNISDRKLTQEVLEKQRAFFRKVIDMNPNLIFAKDRRGRFILVNQAVADVYGVTVEQLIGKTDADFNRDTQQVEHFQRDDLEVLDSLREKFVPEEELTDAHGHKRVLQTVKMPIVGKDGTANLLLGVATDITDRKRAEDEQQRLMVQMQHAQKLESLGVLAGGIAHDFNNLLMAILGNVGLAAVEVSPGCTLSNRLDQIHRAAKRAAELTNQLLAYSGKGQFVVEDVDLGALVLEMASLLETVLSKKAALECSFEPNLPLVVADASQLRQVVMNLITNAADALSDASGQISISTRAVAADRELLSSMYLNDPLPEGTYVCLEVRDSGCGMDETTLQRIFDPFFSTKFTGRGLGLAAVLGIVRSHHGGLTVESSPGEGTTFRVLLPAGHVHPKPRKNALPTTAASSESGVVLVVDDEEAARSVTRAMLEHLGFEVREAHDGAHAISVFRDEPSQYRMVLLDMTMPRMDGIETHQALRAIRSDIPVVLTSGYSEEEASHRLKGARVSAFLQKPYTPDVLQEKVRGVLARTEPA